jgi:peptidoglycan/xylan/chitin deacetylase (PgdA/CDA1 family)
VPENGSRPRDPRAERRRVYRRRRLGAAAAIVFVGLCAWAIVAMAGGAGGAETASLPEDLPPAATGAATEGGAADTSPAPVGTAEVFTRGPSVKQVALTFDDGSCEECVAALLRFLRRTKTPATLFPNGIYADKWEPHAGAVQRLVQSGRLEIGNHTFSHLDATKQTKSELVADLRKNEDWIKRTFVVDPRPFFRPPFGAYDDGVLKTAAELGYTKVVNWSDGSRDWETQDPKAILASVQEQLEPGAIVLMHANGMWTVKALPKILALLKQDGYLAVTITDLLGS